MKIPVYQNVSLRPYHTFGIDCRAHFFAAFQNEAELGQLLAHFAGQPVLILGGGSNVLFTRDFAGAVLQNKIMGIRLVREDAQYAWVRVGAGENWHTFVLHCIAQGWAGVENLSLIPGTVGAAPMQNIGAYGVEVGEVIEQVETLHRATGQTRPFTNEACAFGYRESFFKNEGRDQYIITHVMFRLAKQAQFRLEYGAIRETLAQKGFPPTPLSLQAVSEAVCEIRRSKLPDPAEVGNGGSFFKNPEIELGHYTNLRESFPNIPHFPLPGKKVKIPAAWLIEQAGWKGVRRGDAGVHPRQALVIVNYGQASGAEILALSQEIQQSVRAAFGIALTPEINVL
ncbi:MAG: UDP-N-acetylmuramate dehydrogenase [Microscillaceae bacterium]